MEIRNVGISVVLTATVVTDYPTKSDDNPNYLSSRRQSSGTYGMVKPENNH